MTDAITAGKLLASVLLAVVTIPTLTATTAAADEATDLERGARYLMPFKVDLKAALLAGLEEGPAAAIDACRIEAPKLAEIHSSDGVRVGRTSHRLRNPDNSAPDWVTPTLERWLATGKFGGPALVELDDERFGYVEAIVAAPLCLTCHGKSVAPEVAAAIDELYPDDRATGFEAGDLRGVFWVEFPRQ